MKAPDKRDPEQMAVADAREFMGNMQRYRPSVPPTGECLYCGTALAQGERWCDVECRDEWERAQVSRGIK